MPKETASHINQLVSSNPDGADPKSQGDDHIRMIKQVLLADFPNIGGAVTADHTELSYCDGVTSAIQTQLNAKAPLASPALTGVPTVPTAAADTNTTQAASTAFIVGQAGSSAPTMNGVAAAGASLRYARQDHVHPIDTSRAPLNSPGLTGTPTAPTAGTGTNNTQLATTAFVANRIAQDVPWADTSTGGKVRYATVAESQDFGNSYTALTPYTLDQAYRGSHQSANSQDLVGGRTEYYLSVYVGDIASGVPGSSFSVSFPSAFNSRCIHATAQIVDSGSGAVSVRITWDRFGVSGYVQEWSTLTQAVTVMIRAIGE